MAALAMKQLVPEVPKISPECKKNMSKFQLREYYRKRYEQAKFARCEKKYEKVWDEVLRREQAMAEEAKVGKTTTSSTTDTTMSRSRSHSLLESDDESEVYEFIVHYNTKFGLLCSDRNVRCVTDGSCKITMKMKMKMVMKIMYMKVVMKMMNIGKLRKMKMMKTF